MALKVALFDFAQWIDCSGVGWGDAFAYLRYSVWRGDRELRPSAIHMHILYCDLRHCSILEKVS